MHVCLFIYILSKPVAEGIHQYAYDNNVTALRAARNKMVFTKMQLRRTFWRKEHRYPDVVSYYSFPQKKKTQFKEIKNMVMVQGLIYLQHISS